VNDLFGLEEISFLTESRGEQGTVLSPSLFNSN